MDPKNFNVKKLVHKINASSSSSTTRRFGRADTYKCYKTTDEPMNVMVGECAEMVYKKTDLRKIVKDPSQYPNIAIAFMDMEFLNDLTSYMGTGFLADQYIFITAAHNVYKKKKPARSVEVTFGLNGQEDMDKHKTFSFTGRDFSIPTNYKQETDEYDIAWINLKDYYEKERSNGNDLDWSLKDLPYQYFRTCNVPIKHGVLSESFTICGYPGYPEVPEEGVPGYPALTQWYVGGVGPTRLKDGRHLLYLDATTGGNSGSPVYHLDKSSNIAYAIAVHVGHSKLVANQAVPIEYFIEPSQKHLPSLNKEAKDNNTQSFHSDDSAIQKLLERANLIDYYSDFLSQGADDVRQLYDADDAELLEILSLVGMTKPVHIKRFQRYLRDWGENQEPVGIVPGNTRRKNLNDDSILKLEKLQNELDIAAIKQREKEEEAKRVKKEAQEAIEEAMKARMAADKKLEEETKRADMEKEQIRKKAEEEKQRVIQEKEELRIRAHRAEEEKRKTELEKEMQRLKLEAEMRQKIKKSEEQRLDLLKQDGDGDTGLMIAIDNNNIEKIREIIEQATQLNILDELINKPDHEGRSPLWSSSLKGRNDIVQLLLSNGADINLSNKNGSSPLYIAAQEGHSNVVQTLINNNASIDKAKNDCATPLYVACQNGHLEVVQLLLNNKANPYKTRDTGSTPMYKAAQKGHTKIVEKLLDNNIPITHKSYKDLTILHVASQENKFDTVKLICERDTKKELINENKNNWNTTPLTVGIQNEAGIDVVRLLISYGADPEKKGDGKTPLKWAKSKGKEEVASYLKSIIGNKQENNSSFLSFLKK